MSRSIFDRIAELEDKVVNARTVEASAAFHDQLDLLRLEVGDPAGRRARPDQALRGHKGTGRKRRSLAYEQGYQAGYHAGQRSRE